MAYSVVIQPAAERDLRRIQRVPEYSRIRAAIRALEANLRPAGVGKLQGSANDWRIKVGDYRIVYEIHDQIVLVQVIRVAHHGKAY